MSLVVPRSRELAGDSENQPALLTCRSRVWCYLLSLEAFEVCLLWLKLVSRLQCCKLVSRRCHGKHSSILHCPTRSYHALLIPCTNTEQRWQMVAPETKLFRLAPRMLPFRALGIGRPAQTLVLRTSSHCGPCLSPSSLKIPLLP